MSNPTLSICIPTYNSSIILLETLDSIVSQFVDKDIFSKVEIIISDNASPDDTKIALKPYLDKYHNIHYYRNDINLGASINVIRVTEYANGEYLWLLTDNDCASNFSLKYVLRIIEETNFDLMLGNFDSADQEKIKTFTEEFLGYSVFKGMKEFSSKFGNKGKMNFHSFGSNFSLYSIFFIKNIFFQQSKNALNKEILNTHLFPHSLIIYSNIEDKIIVKPNNIFTLAMGHPSSWKHSMKVYNDFSDVFRSMLYSKKVTTKFKIRIYIFLFRYFIFNFIALSVNRFPRLKAILRYLIDHNYIIKYFSEKIINPNI